MSQFFAVNWSLNKESSTIMGTLLYYGYNMLDCLPSIYLTSKATTPTLLWHDTACVFARQFRFNLFEILSVAISTVFLLLGTVDSVKTGTCNMSCNAALQQHVIVIGGRFSSKMRFLVCLPTLRCCFFECCIPAAVDHFDSSRLIRDRIATRHLVKQFLKRVSWVFQDVAHCARQFYLKVHHMSVT